MASASQTRYEPDVRRPSKQGLVVNYEQVRRMNQGRGRRSLEACHTRARMGEEPRSSPASPEQAERALTWTGAGPRGARDDLLSSRSPVRFALGVQATE